LFVFIQVQSGEDKSPIMDKAMREITDIRHFYFSLPDSMNRVMWFYSLFFRPPIVVIRVPERQQGQQYADVTAAVRGLADEFGLRVIVDGSPNSIPPELQATVKQLSTLCQWIEK
jgi:hypothetical protein